MGIVLKSSLIGNKRKLLFKRQKRWKISRTKRTTLVALIIAPIIAPLIAPIIEIVMKFSLSRNRRNIRFTDRKDEKIVKDNDPSVNYEFNVNNYLKSNLKAEKVARVLNFLEGIINAILIHDQAVILTKVTSQVPLQNQSSSDLHPNWFMNSSNTTF